MAKNILKVLLILIVTVTSLQVSSHFINSYVLEVEAKEKTIADAIIYNQMQQSLKKAEKKIEKSKIEENIVVETEKVEMKPPTVTKEVEVAKDTPEEQPDNGDEVPGNVEAPANVDAIDISDAEQNTNGSANTDQNFIDTNALKNMTEEDILLLGRYLVDNYFLDGYIYYNKETDPIRYDRKKLAYEMESSVISSLNLFVDKGQTTDIMEEVSGLYSNFKEEYQNLTEPEFVGIYDDVCAYFDKYIDVLHKLKIFKETLQSSSNQALTATIALASLKTDIIPGMKDILNTGFDLKEKTNAIYLEGVEGVKLLSKDEVMSIIKDPSFVIPEKNA